MEGQCLGRSVYKSVFSWGLGPNRSQAREKPRGFTFLSVFSLAFRTDLKVEWKAQ